MIFVNVGTSGIQIVRNFREDGRRKNPTIRLMQKLENLGYELNIYQKYEQENL